MPEQNTPTPIKRNEIKKGDRIRQVSEYTAVCNYVFREEDGTTYELLSRPAPMPTAFGLYRISNGMVLELSNMGWRSPDRMNYMTDSAAKSESFTLLRPAAEVAAEVVADMEREYDTAFSSAAALANVAKKWGVTP